MVLLEHYGRDVTRQPLAWLVAGVPILAAAAYYAWAYYLGLHYLSFGIFGGQYQKWGTAEFVLSSEFLSMIGERVLWEVLTAAGAIALALGLFIATARRPAGWRVFLAFLAGVVAYTMATAVGQVHDYYSLPFVAALAPFVGLGWTVLRDGGRAGTVAALTSVLLLGLLSARWLPHQYYYGSSRGVPQIVRVVQPMTAPEDTIVSVTPYGDPTLLYHLHRPGWNIPAAAETGPDAVWRCLEWIDGEGRDAIYRVRPAPDRRPPASLP